MAQSSTKKSQATTNPPATASAPGYPERMKFMTVEDLLTLLIESIAVTFTVGMAIDFAVGLSQLGLPNYPQSIDMSATPAPELKLSIQATPIIAAVEPVPQVEPQPEPELIHQRLKGIDFDRLPLRQARAIARELGIRQKIGGKDQKVDFLRTQIKTKLQQYQEIALAAIEGEPLAN